MLGSWYDFKLHRRKVNVGSVFVYRSALQHVNEPVFYKKYKGHGILHALYLREHISDCARLFDESTHLLRPQGRIEAGIRILATDNDHILKLFVKRAGNVGSDDSDLSKNRFLKLTERHLCLCVGAWRPECPRAIPSTGSVARTLAIE